jgi:hypothetical protein
MVMESSIEFVPDAVSVHVGLVKNSLQSFSIVWHFKNKFLPMSKLSFIFKVIIHTPFQTIILLKVNLGVEISSVLNQTKV